MQANTITLAVDVLNNGTPTNVEFSRHAEELNRSTYRGPGHSLQSRNLMQLYRTLPKRTGNFLGAAKTAIKFTEDITVLGADGANLVSPMIGNTEFSIPVGATPAQMLAFRQKVIAGLDHAFAAALNEYQEI